MERTVSSKYSLSPSPFPLSSCFAGCCLPLSAAETAGQEAYLHPAVWLMHGQQMARGTGNTQAARIIPGEGSTARPQGTASSSLHTGDTPSTRRGMTQTCINTTLTRAWFTPTASTVPYIAASPFHMQASSGPQCSSPAPAAEHSF